MLEADADGCSTFTDVTSDANALETLMLEETELWDVAEAEEGAPYIGILADEDGCSASADVTADEVWPYTEATAEYDDGAAADALLCSSLV